MEDDKIITLRQPGDATDPLTEVLRDRYETKLPVLRSIRGGEI